MASQDNVKEEVPDQSSAPMAEPGATEPGAEGAEPAAEPSGHEDSAAAEDVEIKDADDAAGSDVEIEDADAGEDAGEDAGDEAGGAAGSGEGEDGEKGPEYDPTFDQTLLKPLFERRDKSLKELLASMDEFAPIIPDAVTDYYLARSGLKTNDQRIKRLLALATQKFISDIASDAYQYARIRSQTGGASGAANRGRGGQGAAASSRTVLTMESLSGILGDYGVNAKRPDFYR